MNGFPQRVGTPRYNDEVHVIGHEAVRVKPQLKMGRGRLQEPVVQKPVRIVSKYVRSSYSSLGDMQGNPGNNDPSNSWHKRLASS